MEVLFLLITFMGDISRVSMCNASGLLLSSSSWFTGINSQFSVCTSVVLTILGKGREKLLRLRFV